jgi:hypothetical protein
VVLFSADMRFTILSKNQTSTPYLFNVGSTAYIVNNPGKNRFAGLVTARRTLDANNFYKVAGNWYLERNLLTFGQYQSYVKLNVKRLPKPGPRNDASSLIGWSIYLHESEANRTHHTRLSAEHRLPLRRHRPFGHEVESGGDRPELVSSIDKDAGGFVAKSGNQTSIAGNKTWTGQQIYTATSSAPSVFRNGTAGTQELQVYHTAGNGSFIENKNGELRLFSPGNIRVYSTSSASVIIRNAGDGLNLWSCSGSGLITCSSQSQTTNIYDDATSGGRSLPTLRDRSSHSRSLDQDRMAKRGFG